MQKILLKVIKLFDFNHRFKFQEYVHNGCHDLFMLSVNISDITIIIVKNVDYHCIIHNIKSKSKAINLLKNLLKFWIFIKNIVLLLKTVFFILFFLFSIYKMVDIIDIYK